MPDIGPSMPSAYLTDGEILAWLQEKSEDQYADLRNVMNASTARGELMNDLTQLKADIDSDKPADEIIAEMETIRETYAGTPYQAEVDELLLPMEAKYLRCIPPDSAEEQKNSFIENIAKAVLPPELKADLFEQAKAEETEENPAYSVRRRAVGKEVSTSLQSEVDQLGRIDQLELIKIQELVSDARQTSQLGSNILASRDQASNAIVGNIRG